MTTTATFLSSRASGRGARFLLDHPEWQIREQPPGPYYKLSTPLDFTFSQVRDYVVGVMGRLVDRFPVDGLGTLLQGPSSISLRGKGLNGSI